MFFKVLDKNLCADGREFVEGLNEDVAGPSLSFCSEKQCLPFLCCEKSKKIAIVTLPEGEEVVDCDNFYKSKRIVLSEIHDIWAVETFEWLNENGVDLHAYSDYAFRNAALQEHLDVAEYLVKHGADIHTCDDFVLRTAIVNGQEKVVQFMLEHGFRITVQNAYILDLAHEHEQYEIYEILRKGVEVSL